MDLKWLMIAWAVIMTSLVAEQAYKAKTTADCRIAFSQSNKTADEINKICDK